VTQEQLRRIWAFLGLTLVFYALNSLIVVQGGDAVLGGKLIHEAKGPAAVIAIPVCTVLLTLVSIVGLLFARRAPGPCHARPPVIAFEGPNTCAPEARA